MPFNKPMELAMAGELVAMPQQSLVLDIVEPALLQLTDLFGLQQLWSLVVGLTSGFC
jgi:hypothetical protein